VKILFWLTLFFIVLPLVELALLLKLADLTDWKVSLLLVIVTGVVGAVLSKHQGISLLRRMQTDLREGRMPADSLLDAALILAAGILLITPGVLTDLLGIVLLIPPLRRVAKMGLIGWFRSKFRIQTIVTGSDSDTGPPDSPDVIDAKVVRRS
jgi:UPF0716 protein FxsA